MRFVSPLAIAATISWTAGCASGSVHSLRRQEAKQSNPAPLTATQHGTIFDVEVRFGDQPFMLLVDTGSSDTWVVQSGFRCIDASDNNMEQPEAACGYAATYDITPTFQPVDDQTFGVKYGTGIAMGTVGTEDITMGGITVPSQTVGIVNSTDDDVGDGLQSGILGLGYPSLTSAHPGHNYPNDSTSLITNRSAYDPLFHSMYKRGLVAPWFSIALDRLPADTESGPGGYLGLGELPPVTHSDDWAVAPVEITESIPLELYEGDPERTYWTVAVDAVTWGTAEASATSTLPSTNTTTNSTAFQAVVDTGNPINLFPEAVARAINDAFDPPAVYDEETDAFAVDCNARAPALGVVIKGKTFWHDSRDMIIPAGKDTCTTGVGATQEALGVTMHFLGDTFLKNVVSVFDFGKDEMRFAARINGGNHACSSKESGRGRVY